MSYLTIRIIRVGQPTVEVTVQKGATAASALAIADVNTSGAQIRFNGVTITGNSKLQDNGDLMVTKAIQGAN